MSAKTREKNVKEWQELWNQYTSNKLYSVQLAVGRSVS